MVSTLTPLDILELALLEDDTMPAWKTADLIAMRLIEAGYRIVPVG